MAGLAAVAAILAKAGASDVVGRLAEAAGVAVIERVTGLKADDPEAAKRLAESQKLQAELIRELRSMDLKSQELATSVELKMLSSEDKRVRNTRPLTQRVFIVLITLLILVGVYAIWQEVSFQKELFSTCIEAENRAECFRYLEQRTSFISQVVLWYGTPMMMMIGAGIMAYMNVYSANRSREKIAGQDATITRTPAKPEPRTKKRFKLPRRLPRGAKNG